MPDRFGWSTAALAVTTALRTALVADALRSASAPRPSPRPDGDQTPQVSVLIPIRSGDPLLEQVLRRSLATLTDAAVLLLVDDDDPAGIEAARSAAADHPRAEVHAFAPPPAGTNPKLHKLALAPTLGEVAVVLDDDVTLFPGGLAALVAALADAELVTGIPVYADAGGLWSRLLGAFVNSSALPTYLATARLGPPVSVNGMVLAMRRRDLERAGGFTSLLDATCDDYALALAFRRHGMRLKQTTVVATLATTVPSARDYAGQMRRWMLFADQVVRRDLSPRLIGVVVLPAVLPVVAVATALRTRRGRPAALLAVLASAAATRALRSAAGAPPERADSLVLEALALLLAPLHLVAAVLGPRTVTWRGRRVRVGVGSAAARSR